MTEQERRKLESDYFYYTKLLEVYSQNREMFTMLSDTAFEAHLNSILDAMNNIRKLLNADEKKSK